MKSYHYYISGPEWAARRRRHLAQRPWCRAHGAPCRARTVHHASYFGWRMFGREAPWELVGLCRPAHAQISRWHVGWFIPNVLLFALTWTVIGWARLSGWRRS